MTLPRDAWQEDSQEPIPQDLTPGSDTQAAPISMTENPMSSQGTEAISDTPTPYTGEGTLKKIGLPGESLLHYARPY